MNKTIEIGKINNLLIDEESDFGMFLKAKDDERVLLPNAYVEDFMKVGEYIDVYIYSDSEDRLVATTQRPIAYINEFCYAEVVDMTKFGAFVDIGLPKHLLIPRIMQNSDYKIGDKKLIMIRVDKFGDRLIGTEKFREFIKFCDKEYKLNEEVKIIVISVTPLGYKVVVENSYEGLIFANEVFEKIEVGDVKTAYVKKVRKDGKLDIGLQKIGNKHGNNNQNTLIEKIKQSGGKLPLNSKSSPEEISKYVGMSKKAFKLSLNKLLDEKKIKIIDDGIIIA